MALVGMGVVAPAATAASSTWSGFRPVPLAPGAELHIDFSSPPTTAQCEAAFGLACYQPAQLETAYDLNSLYSGDITGAGETIVIVDAFGSPTIQHDLGVFDETFGLPDPPNFQIIQPAGTVPAYPRDPFGKADRANWAFETTLDVEWSHAMAPGANILLVETPQSETEGVQGFPQIVAAENYVINHHLGQVISQSFGATEQSFQPSPLEILKLRSAFVNAANHNVTVLAASGDAGATDLLPDESCCYPFRVTSWPPSDPLVTAVGGTQLHLDANGNRTAPDSVWNDQAFFGSPAAGGGGQSIVFPRPAFQNPVARVVGGQRGVPDVSMSAAVNGAVDVFYSFKDYSQTPAFVGPEWQIVGGTSEATPLMAGIVALADQAVGHSVGYLNPYLYSSAHVPGIVDVKNGNNTVAFCSANCGGTGQVNTTVNGFNAVPGYDLASGLGTIDGYQFVNGIRNALGG
ncbi:MAG TPA: S53 family peptidase [Acidimicrobiales bacterium]|nr:S53 family peptidase [Acidimicrobiales bacterium]